MPVTLEKAAESDCHPPKHHFTCDHCGENHHNDVKTRAQKDGRNLDICDDCLNNHFEWCEKTDAYYHESEMEEVLVSRRNGGYVSMNVHEAWREDNCYSCDDCGQYHEYSSSHEVSGNQICPSCYEDNYFRCNSCEEHFHNDDYGEDGMCQSCVDSQDSDDDGEGIYNYDYKPRNLKFRGEQKTKDPFIGFELECECPEDENRSQFLEYINQEYLYVKNDGSLDHGIEIVSHPATLEVHKGEKYETMFKTLSKQGLKSHDTRTCGLHFHLDRTKMTENHKVRLGMLIAFCQKEFEKLARRNENQYSQYKKVDRNLTRYENDDRYSALNWRNDKTVEFRIFRGTLKYSTFIASMELCHAAYAFTHSKDCFSIPESHEIPDVVSKVEYYGYGDRIFKKFLRFVYKEKTIYAELIEYMKTKNFNVEGI